MRFTAYVFQFFSVGDHVLEIFGRTIGRTSAILGPTHTYNGRRQAVRCFLFRLRNHCSVNDEVCHKNDIDKISTEL